MFVPLVTLTNAPWRALTNRFLVSVLASLEVILSRQGPLAPIAEHHLLMLKWFNLLLFAGPAVRSGPLLLARLPADKHLRRLAVVDALTGLYNRHHFEQVWSISNRRDRAAVAARPVC